MVALAWRCHCSSCFSGEMLLATIPGQKLMNVFGRVIPQPRQDVGEPGLRVDIVELAVAISA
jgi:hypothetical protein